MRTIQTQYAGTYGMTCLMVPEDAEFLTAYEQYNSICVVILGDTSRPHVSINVHSFTAGALVPDRAAYLATVDLYGTKHYLFLEKP